VIYHTYRTIFIHIPKTAGNSVAGAFGFGWPAHTDLGRYAETLRPEIFRGYFKFAVVRNPWDRMLSEFVFQRKKHKPRHEKPFVFDERGARRGFAEWIRSVLAKPGEFPGPQWAGDVSPSIHRWSPQVDWISVDGMIAVDFVARMERLESDFETVRRRAGLPVGSLPRHNRTRHRHYSHYYDAETRHLVAEYYAADIEEFGYRFETTPTSTWAWVPWLAMPAGS
jgi:chondroitin 4-sulfotransferase 11